MKICPKCKKSKEITEYSRHKANKDGLRSYCKSCTKESAQEYQKTVNGVITTIYSSQKRHSKFRNHPLPNYTKGDLIRWIEHQPSFPLLYYNWVASNYDTKLKPSIDRIKDELPYTLGNIQLVTWIENREKQCINMINGVDNRQSKKVIQLDLEGNPIKEHHSLASAERATGVVRSSIRRVIKGERNHAGGFLWKYG